MRADDTVDLIEEVLFSPFGEFGSVGLRGCPDIDGFFALRESGDDLLAAD